MSQYADAAAAVHGKSTARSSHVCGANGCPLPATRTNSTTGSQTWYCRVHIGMSPGLFDGITARINNRLDLYRLAYPLTNNGGVDRKVRDQIRTLGRAEFLSNPEPGIPRSAYGLARHIFAVLDAECRAPQAHMGVPTTEGATWMDDDE